jgi:hypothetical protein
MSSGKLLKVNLNRHTSRLAPGLAGLPELGRQEFILGKACKTVEQREIRQDSRRTPS